MPDFKFNVGDKVVRSAYPEEVREVKYPYSNGQYNFYIITSGAFEVTAREDVLEAYVEPKVPETKLVFAFMLASGQPTDWYYKEGIKFLLNHYENLETVPDDQKIVGYVWATQDQETRLITDFNGMGDEYSMTAVEDFKYFLRELDLEELEKDDVPTLTPEWFDRAEVRKGDEVILPVSENRITLGDILSRVLASQPEIYKGVVTSNGNVSHFHGLGPKD